MNGEEYIAKLSLFPEGTNNCMCKKFNGNN